MDIQLKLMTRACSIFLSAMQRKTTTSLQSVDNSARNFKSLKFSQCIYGKIAAFFNLKRLAQASSVKKETLHSKVVFSRKNFSL